MQVSPLILSAGDNFADGGQYNGAGNGGAGGAGNFSNGGGSWHILFGNCDDAGILAAHPNYDSGVITTGPTLQAPTVPPDVYENKFLGTTPCGHTLQLVHSITYTLRSIPAQYVADGYVRNWAALYGGTPADPIIPSGTQVPMVHADTVNLCLAAFDNACFALGVPQNGLKGGVTYTYIGPNGSGGSREYLYNCTPVGGTRALYLANSRSYPGMVDATMHTVYYLDTHETITYSMV